jgi:hypothetical protein
VRQPQQVERIAIEGQDHDWAAADAPHFTQARVGVGPLMDRHRGHCGVEAGIGERQLFGDGVERGREMRRTLCAHRRRRLDRRDLAVDGFVRASTRADVDDS